MKKRINTLSLVLLIGTNTRSGIIWADEVTDWNVTLFQAAHTANTNPLVTTRVAAIVQAAVLDAVNGIERPYTPIHVTTRRATQLVSGLVESNG